MGSNYHTDIIMPAICAGRKENLHTSRRSHGKIRWDDGCPPTSKNIAKKYLSTLIIRDNSKYLGRVPTIADRRGKIRSYDGSLRMTPPCPCHLQWSNLHPMPKIVKEAGPVITPMPSATIEFYTACHDRRVCTLIWYTDNIYFHS